MNYNMQGMTKVIPKLFVMLKSTKVEIKKGIMLGNVAEIQNFPTCHQDLSMEKPATRERSASTYPCRSRAEAFKRTGLRELFSS